MLQERTFFLTLDIKYSYFNHICNVYLVKISTYTNHLEARREKESYREIRVMMFS